MSKDWKTLLSETKTQLKELLDKNPSQEQINAITSLDKSLDVLNEQYNEKVDEVNSLKDTLIESVKSTGFKVASSQNDDSGIEQNQKSMDEIMSEELDKILASKK